MRKGNIFTRATDKWGFEAQIRVLQEECAELIVAVSHVARGRKGAMREFIEELVDAHIMLVQMEEYLVRTGRGEEFGAMWNSKLDRLARRLKDE